MPRLKKGVSFTIGGRTFKNEISDSDVEFIKAHFKPHPKSEKPFDISKVIEQPKKEKPVKEEPAPKEKAGK